MSRLGQGLRKREEEGLETKTGGKEHERGRNRLREGDINRKETGKWLKQEKKSGREKESGRRITGKEITCPSSLPSYCIFRRLCVPSRPRRSICECILFLERSPCRSRWRPSGISRKVCVPCAP